MNSEQPDISSLIMSAPDEVWLKIRDALGVQNRERAAQLAVEDPDVAQVVSSILESASTQDDGSAPVSEESPAASPPDTSSAPRTRAPAETLYGDWENEKKPKRAGRSKVSF